MIGLSKQLQRPPIKLNVQLHRRKSSSSSEPFKTYSPNKFEQDYYNLWNDKGCFQPKESKRVFSVILPPPNVTGTLHLGHALTVTSLDTLARWKRMCGDEVVWVPGIDHAGIATQVVVEKYLERQGISKSSIDREQFLKEVWKWKDSKGSTINSQLKTLGSSLDWTREVFTMDKVQSKAVVEALIILWNKGLIYRNETLVNWSPHLRSTISDIEVNYVEVNGPTAFDLPGYSKPVEFGKITDFAYKVDGSDEEIIVSTTRVETMLGDVAVAVNPNDDRYRHLWGSVLHHPFTGKQIPLILDYTVDPKFGTGALKVTPAHDQRDYHIAKSHDLPLLNIINEDGAMENCGSFSGLKRFEARQVVMNALAEKGLLRETRPHKMNLPICSRSGDVIELLVKPQWFIKSKGMAERAISAVKENKLIITPEKYCDNWFHWLENIQDWCISRQLWWGHQIPFYLCEGGGKQTWFPARNEKEAEEIAASSFSGPVSVTRDPDVLDTWFSSALLPFSSFGWPRNTEDFQRYYPLQTLVTGNDILFFWVARMVMLGLELTDSVPFKKIFLHGLICDSQGRKMSKSLGNVIDPEDIIKGKSLNDLTDRISNSFLSPEEIKKAKTELKRLYPRGIPTCGVDALRFTLLSYNIKNQNVNFDLKECEVSRRFCNKVWQACNFAKGWLKKYPLDEKLIEHSTLSLIDKWILAKLDSMLTELNKALSSYDFHLATNALRTFIHHELCDVYIECVKPVYNQGNLEEIEPSLRVLRYTLESSIRCMSPFMPFLAEYLDDMLMGPSQHLVMERSMPTVDKKIIDHSVEEAMSSALDIVYTIRKLKHDIGLNNQHSEVWLSIDFKESKLKDIIQVLAHCDVHIGVPDMENSTWKKEAVSEGLNIFIKTEDSLQKKNVDILSVVKRKNKLKKELDKFMKMTSNEGYKKVPAEIQKAHQEKIFKLETELKNIESLEQDIPHHRRLATT